MKNYRKLLATTLAVAAVVSTTGCGIAPKTGMRNNAPAPASNTNFANNNNKQDVDTTDTQDTTDVALSAGEHRLTIDDTNFALTFGDGCVVTDYDTFLDVQKDIDGEHNISWMYSGGYTDIYDTSCMTISDDYIGLYDYVDYEDARAFAVKGETGYVSYVTYRDSVDNNLWVTGKIWQDVGVEHYLEIDFTTNYGDYLRDIDELVECSVVAIGDKSYAASDNNNDSYDYDGDSSSFVGNYKTDDLYNPGYLDVLSTDEISLRLPFADGWTYTNSFYSVDENTIHGTCYLYVSEAEPDDFVSFTLEKIGDSVYMTVDSTDCPLLNDGDVYVFSAY